MNLIDHKRKLARDEENCSRLAILLSILEPLLVNDSNLEKALKSNLVEILFSILHVPDEFKQY